MPRLGHAECDQCYAEHPEPYPYAGFPTCTWCRAVVCPACSEPGTYSEDEEGAWCRCLECAHQDADAYVGRLRRALAGWSGLRGGQP